jgi:hypothetical protein
MSVAITGSVSMVSAEIVGAWLESENVDSRTVAWWQAATAVVTGLAVAKSHTAKTAAFLTALHYSAQAMGAPDVIGHVLGAVPSRMARSMLGSR